MNSSEKKIEKIENLKMTLHGDGADGGADAGVGAAQPPADADADGERAGTAAVFGDVEDTAAFNAWLDNALLKYPSRTTYPDLYVLFIIVNVSHRCRPHCSACAALLAPPIALLPGV